MKKKIRLDQLLVIHQHIETLEKAVSFIMQGKILVNEKKILKPGELVNVTSVIRVLGESKKYVSRGGDKLAGALSTFSVSPQGKVALDIGVSTGGFSDVLLQKGAKAVIGMDVGYGQVAHRVATHPNAIIIERFNVRHLTTDIFREKLQEMGRPSRLIDEISLLVMDVSFISVTALLPTLRDVIGHSFEAVILIKPQFEAPPESVGEGGIVSDVTIREHVFKTVLTQIEAMGFRVVDTCESPIKGTKGNTEYFAYLTY